jgi:hypothetical protein
MLEFLRRDRVLSKLAFHRLRDQIVHEADTFLKAANRRMWKPKMRKVTVFAERLFPKARGNEALVSLVVASLGLAGGVATIGLILFVH